MIFGWTGRILHIDLTTQKIEVETPDLETYACYIGGKGMGGRYLRPVAHLPWDHPDMVVSIFSGPLAGTISPTSGRAHLVSKSPLTGLVGDSSVGGKFATRLKQAGWDGMVIKGQCSHPVGIEIMDSRIEFRDAKGLWGMDTDAVHRCLSPGHGSLAALGPGAENG